MRFTITEHAEPDHPWDGSNQIEGWCLSCGAQEIIHDGNLRRVFDAMEAAGRKADEVWWYIA